MISTNDVKAYTGIGGRDTPRPVCDLMADIGYVMAERGWTLRSGGADGADNAFARRLKRSHPKEIYLPDVEFNGHVHNPDNGFYALTKLPLTVQNECLEWVYRCHPKPKALRGNGIRLMARNTLQVLGRDLESPTKFIICWTSDGKASGGTGQALRIAKVLDIPVLNLYHPNVVNYIKMKLGL